MHKNDLRRASNVFTFDQKCQQTKIWWQKSFLFLIVCLTGSSSSRDFLFISVWKRIEQNAARGVTFMILKQLRELCFRTVCKRKREIRCRLFSYSVPYRITGGSVLQQFVLYSCVGFWCIVTVQPPSNSRRFCAIFSAKTRVERRSLHSRSEFSMGERKLLFTPSIGRE